MTMHQICFEPDPQDSRPLREALGRFATGVTIVTTRTEAGKLEGLTANSFSALSLDPPLVLWSLKKTAPSRPSFEQSGYFAVNVLCADQKALSKHFATPTEDKFSDVHAHEGHGGCPVLPGCLATFECSTETTVVGGDHIIFIGRVHRATYRTGEPLIFSSGSYATHSPLLDA